MAMESDTKERVRTDARPTKDAGRDRKPPRHEAEDDASRMSIEIERGSPDGLPAYPRMRQRSFGALLALIAMLVVVGGVLVGLLYDATTGLFAAAVGMLLLLGNPEIWAGMARVRERERIRAELRNEDTRSPRR
jgi:hypothetical protein